MGKKIGQGQGLVWCFFLILVFALIGCGSQQSAPPAAPPSSGAQAPATTPPPATAQPAAAPTVPATPAQPAPTAAAPATPTQTPPAGTSQPSPAPASTPDLKQLYLGMPGDQAQSIMGTPAETRPGKGVTRLFYSMPQGRLEIRVKNNQVIALELE
jgi:hypothetical protein